ncbi:MAG: hypothetical protein ACP5NX_02955 [Candidatus Bilamarchaeaceae archaeon]
MRKLSATSPSVTALATPEKRNEMLHLVPLAERRVGDTVYHFWTNAKQELFRSCIDAKRQDLFIHKMDGSGIDDEWVRAEVGVNKSGMLQIYDIYNQMSRNPERPPYKYARGRGLFGIALAECIACASEKGIHIIGVVPANEALEAYYGRYGFAGWMDRKMVKVIEPEALRPKKR